MMRRQNKLLTDEKTALYETHKPSLASCCLCGSTEGPFVTEDRPTGFNFALQKWAFCPQCFESSQSNGTDPAAYKVLLAVIFGDPRRFRAGGVPIDDSDSS